MDNLPGRSAGQVGAVVLGSDFKALGYIRSLGKRRIPCVVVDDLPRSAWFSRYARRRLRWHGGMWGPAFVDFLLQMARQHGLDGWLLVPVQDEVVECVARNRERLGGTFRLVTQDWETLRWAHDKRLAYKVADELGVPHPKTWYPTDALDLERMAIDYPAIVKPSISIHLQYATGRKAFAAGDPDELRAVYRRAAAVMEPDALMVQEMIPGDGGSQYSVAAFCKDGEWLAGMTARRTRQYPVDFGLSSSFVEAIDVPQLVEPAKKLIARCRLSGMVEVEFKRDPRDGVDKLLDINVRPWGWHTLCIACGLDFPYIQFADALGEAAPMGPVRYGHRWRRLLTDVPAALQEVAAGSGGPWAYLRSLGGGTVHSVADVRDPLPMIGDLAVAVSRIVKARRGRPLIPALPPLPVGRRPRST
jgi:predicted ATP-grasp superfamily ATP-dependent carboligase